MIKMQELKLFNPDGTLTEEGMKAQREAKARGADRAKRARRSSSGSRKGFNFYMESDLDV